MLNIEESIAATKQEFEESFSVGEFYNKQTQDESHLKTILDFLPISAGMKILDLGTGSGYLSFAIAKKYPDVSVVGLDIVDKTLKNNQIKADSEGVNNLCFVCYDGINFPFNNNMFDMVVTRYALHHFPIIEKSLSEVYRVLNEDGLFFISDPTPDETDIGRFVDKFMQVKKDGHIKFYTKNEWLNLCVKKGFLYIKSFSSVIRFPRKMDSIYDSLIKNYDKNLTDKYEIEIIEDEIYITERVNNLLFCRK